MHVSECTVENLIVKRVYQILGKKDIGICCFLMSACITVQVGQLIKMLISSVNHIIYSHISLLVHQSIREIRPEVSDETWPVPRSSQHQLVSLFFLITLSFLSPSSCALKGPLNHSAWALWLVDLSAWLNSHFHHTLHGRVTGKRNGEGGGVYSHTDRNCDPALPPGISPHWWWQTFGLEEETGSSECRLQGNIRQNIAHSF